MAGDLLTYLRLVGIFQLPEHRSLLLLESDNVSIQACLGRPQLFSLSLLSLQLPLEGRCLIHPALKGCLQRGHSSSLVQLS